MEQAEGNCRNPRCIALGRSGHTALGCACMAGYIVSPLLHAFGRCCGIACKVGIRLQLFVSLFSIDCRNLIKVSFVCQVQQISTKKSSRCCPKQDGRLHDMHVQHICTLRPAHHRDLIPAAYAQLLCVVRERCLTLWHPLRWCSASAQATKQDSMPIVVCTRV